MSKLINSFDIDGVIFMGKYGGVYPGPDDIIITGRSIEERKETHDMLRSKGIYNRVFFNSTKFDEKTREDSGFYKARTLKEFIDIVGYNIGIHFEDDPIQADIITNFLGDRIKVVLLQHNLTEKENIRHDNLENE